MWHLIPWEKPASLASQPVQPAIESDADSGDDDSDPPPAAYLLSTKIPWFSFLAVEGFNATAFFGVVLRKE